MKLLNMTLAAAALAIPQAVTAQHSFALASYLNPMDPMANTMGVVDELYAVSNNTDCTAIGTELAAQFLAAEVICGTETPSLVRCSLQHQEAIDQDISLSVVVCETSPLLRIDQ